MIKIKVQCAVLFLVALLSAALAAEANAETLSWTPPDTRVDGTPLAPEEIGEYRLKCGDVVTTIQPGQTEYVIEKHKALPGYGDNQCHMTVVDTEGLESAPSNEVQIDYQKQPPEPLTIRLI